MAGTQWDGLWPGCAGRLPWDTCFPSESLGCWYIPSRKYLCSWSLENSWSTTSITILVVDSISQCHSSIALLVHGWSVVTPGLIYPLSRSLNLLVFSGVPGRQLLRMKNDERGKKRHNAIKFRNFCFDTSYMCQGRTWTYCVAQASRVQESQTCAITSGWSLEVCNGIYDIFYLPRASHKIRD